MQNGYIVIDRMDVEVKVSQQGTRIEQLCLIEEVESKLLLAVDSSYVEQCVDAVRSPYGNGTIVFAEGDDNSELQPDVIQAKLSEKNLTSHPKHTIEKWKSSVAKDMTTLGYWEWVSQEVTKDS